MGGIGNSNQSLLGGQYNYYLYGNTSSGYANGNNMLITPCLHAEAGEQFSFDIKNFSSFNSAYYVKAYLSKDRKDWGEPVLTISEDIKAFTTQTITAPEAGDYYVAIALYGFALDNLCGFHAVEKARDFYVDTFSIGSYDTVKSGEKVTATSDVYLTASASAADYKVALYFDGEKVGEGVSADLVADAKTKKNFSVSFTPETTQTKTADVRMALEFTDGTVIECGALPLTVTFQPEFGFYEKENHGSKWYHDSLNKLQAWGKTNSASNVRHYEFYNWGSAPQVVKSITAPAGFTASIASATVPAMEGVDVDLDFCPAAIGTYEGNLTIVYVDAEGNDATYELPLSGTMLDATKWYATFDNGTTTAEWPAGSLRWKNVSAENKGTSNEPNFALYCSSSASSADRMFSTPKLHAEAGESLDFDARLYNTSNKSGMVKVYASQTRMGLLDEEGRTLLATFSGQEEDEANLLTDAWKTCSVVPGEGDWYIGLELSDRVLVDEIYGLAPVAVAHEWIVSGFSAPATAVQNELTMATLSLLNLGLAEEDASLMNITLYVDGQPRPCEVEQTIPTHTAMNETPAALQLAFRHPKTGTYSVYAKVEADGYELVTEPVEVTFSEEVLSGEKTVGTYKECRNSVPVYLNYKKSESLLVYTPEMLGLEDGAVIESISIYGYCSTADWTTNLRVYSQLADDSQAANPAALAIPTEGMRELYNGTYDWKKGGSASERIEMFRLNLEEPIVYEGGKSLKLVFSSEADSYKNYYFEATEIQNAWYHNSDSNLTSSYTNGFLPVLHLGLKAEARSISGTVKDTQGNVLAGALVNLTSVDGDNVQYETLTDAEGNYRLNVIQSSRIYDLDATAEGLQEFAEDIEVAAESKQLDLVLRPVFRIHHDATHQGGAASGVVYLDNTYEEGFNVITLPVSLDKEEVVELFGPDAVVMQFAQDAGEEDVTVLFEQVETMTAGVPYMVYLTEPVEPILWKEKEVCNSLSTVMGEMVQFVATTARTPLTDGMFRLSGDDFYELGGIMPLSEVPSVPAYSAYIRAIDPAVSSIHFTTFAELPTGIEDATLEVEGEQEVWNLNGIRVKNPEKGIYVIGGKLVRVK